MTPVQPVPETRQEYLGAIPLLMSYINRLQIRQIIDQELPVAAQAPVSHGECVVALLLALFLKEHRLYKIDERLLEVDLASFLQHGGISPRQFNDTRLGWTLDTLFEKTARLYALVISLAIRTFGLRIKRFHADFTSVVLNGSYPGSEEMSLLHTESPVPARGYSKDHRPDLLQLLWSLVVTQDGVPVMGNFENGNAAESELFRKNMTQLAGMLEDLRAEEGSVMIGDSKLCSIPTMAQAADLKMPILTLMPENWKFRREAIEKALKTGNIPVLMITEGKEEYRGVSWMMPVLIEIPGQPNRHVWLRLMAVFSSRLAKQKAESRLRARRKEGDQLKKWSRVLERREFACEADARKVLAHEWEKAKSQFHSMSAQIVPEEKRGKGKPGRPAKRAKPQLTNAWRVKLTMTEKELPPIEGLDPEGFFVLVTTVTDKRKMSDADMIRIYKEQKSVEIAYHWMKGELAVAPVFLKTPQRIQALGLIFLLALLTSVLIQRDLRKGLGKRGGTVAYFGGKRTTVPTWNSVLDLFHPIRAMWVKQGDIWHRILHLFKQDHQEVLDLFDLEEIYQGKSSLVYT